MKLNRPLLSVAALALLGFPVHAFGMAADYAPGAQISHPDSWPPRLLELAKEHARVAGYFVNGDDYLAFQGDAAAFQRFLDTCAALGDFGQTTLHLRQGKGAFQPLDAKRPPVPCDWRLEIIDQQLRSKTPDPGQPRHHLELHVWLGGGVKMDQVKLPAGLMVSKD